MSGAVVVNIIRALVINTDAQRSLRSFMFAELSSPITERLINNFNVTRVIDRRLRSACS